MFFLTGDGLKRRERKNKGRTGGQVKTCENIKENAVFQVFSPAPQAGFEPTTVGLEIRCSIQLSYWGRTRSSSPTIPPARRQGKQNQTDIAERISQTQAENSACFQNGARLVSSNMPPEPVILVILDASPGE
jgi:hypothetical protein